MSASTACIVRCDGCGDALVHEVDSGVASLFVGRVVAEMRGWRVVTDRASGVPSGRRGGKDFCPTCVGEGRA